MPVTFVASKRLPGTFVTCQEGNHAALRFNARLSSQIPVLNAQIPATTSCCSCSQVACMAPAGARASLQQCLKYGNDISRSLECLHAAGQAADNLSPVRMILAACTHLRYLHSWMAVSCRRARSCCAIHSVRCVVFVAGQYRD